MRRRPLCPRSRSPENSARPERIPWGKSLASWHARRAKMGYYLATVRCLRSILISSALPLLACSSTVPTTVTAGPDGSRLDAGPIAKVPIGMSPVRGPEDAWVTMIEFGDFECPFCGAEEPIVEALVQAYPVDLRLVFKNFPLTTIHPYAEGAAVAAECAKAQGDFWKMHDLLYANQNALQSQNLSTYAKESGVDLMAWQACLATQPPVDAIYADVALATSVGVDATPTFFVNGEIVVGAVPEAQLQAVIEAARTRAEASGVPRASYYDTVILGQ
jgi:protein-disulfide isomerase